MYQQFFQFRRLPFQLTPDPHFFFFTARHEEAFNQALYGVKERKGFMVLTGEVGTGKTTLSRLLIEHLGARVHSSLLFNPNLTTVELLQSINHDFGIHDQSYSKKILTDYLNQFLLDRLMQGGNALLVVDEAQTLPIECLEEIRLLSNLETPRAKLLQILLVGQPELTDKLALPQLRQLNQRITLRAELAPLSPQEVADYIQYRLWRAGGRETVHFEPAAIELVCRYSQGIPRLINALCDRALLAAYVRGTRRISGFVMGQAVGELTPMLATAEPPPPYLTHEEPTPRPELHRATRPDAARRLALLGLASVLIGLFLVWWRADTPGRRFPTASLAQPAAERAESPISDLSAPLPPEAPGSDTRVPAHLPLFPAELITASAPQDAPPQVEPWPPALRIDHAELSVSFPAEEIAEEPVSVVRASIEAPPAEELYLDAEGVMRAATPEQRERAAALMLLRAWGVPVPWSPGEAAPVDPITLVHEHRLEIMDIPLTVEELMKLDYPAIVYRPGGDHGEPPAPAVWLRVQDHEAILLDPRAGLIRRPVQEFAGELAGEARLLWRPLNGWRWPGPIDGPDPVIGWMQRRLRDRQLYRGAVDGLLGPETEQALQRLAAQRGLTGPLTNPLVELLISQLLAPAEFPRLSDPETQPSAEGQDPAPRSAAG
ncbi:MAG: AAA family ATPase [Nitrospirota bacterium]